MTSFSGGPLTEEEEYLLDRFKILREKKKLLKKLKEKAETKVKPTVKRETVPTPSITPEDAKRKAEMLVASGCVKISKTSVSREFKRARTSEKKVTKDNLSDQELTTLVEKKPLQSTSKAEMKEMYHSNFVKSGERRDNDSNGSHGHRDENRGSREENKEYREENRGYREENRGYRGDNRGYREENRGYREENRGYSGPRKGNTIFIKGYGLTEEIVRNEFHKFGIVTDVRFERDRFGFVTYKTADEAEKAIKEMNGARVKNVNIHVLYARRQSHNDRGDNPLWSRDSPPPRDHQEEPPKINRELQKYEEDFFN